nr:hypothetical protein [uncultured Roseateles sp.]
MQQTACVALPKGLGGVLTVLLNSLLLSHMAPAEFGAYAICLTLVALADGVLGSAIDMSVIKLASVYRLSDLARAAAVERWGVALKLAVSLGLVCVALLLAERLSGALFKRPAPQLLVLALAVAAGVLLLRSAFLNLQLQQRFGAYAALELLAQALRVGGIAAVLLWSRPDAQVLMAVAGLCTLTALLGAAWLVRPRWPGQDLLPRREGRELAQAVRWMFITFAFSALLSRADLLLLTQYSSLEQVGLFAAGQVFAQIPELLGSYLAVVVSPRVAPASQSGTLRVLMSQVQGGLLLLALLVMLAVPVLLHFGAGVLPRAYAGSAEVLMLLLAGSLAAMCAFPVAIPYLMFVKPDFIFKLDLYTLPLLLAAYYFAIPAAGAVGAAWVSGGARLLKLGLMQACAWNWARQGLPAGAATQ